MGGWRSKTVTALSKLVPTRSVGSVVPTVPNTQRWISCTNSPNMQCWISCTNSPNTQCWITCTNHNHNRTTHIGFWGCFLFVLLCILLHLVVVCNAQPRQIKSIPTGVFGGGFLQGGLPSTCCCYKDTCTRTP